MTIIALLPFLLALAGLLVYALSNNAKICELARILFFVGAFFAVWSVASDVVRVGPAPRAAGR